MADYYVPLSSLTGSLGLNHVPLVGDALADWFRHALQFLGVRQCRETWNDVDATIRGTAVFGGSDLAVNLGAFELALGKPVGGTTEVEFELSWMRASLFSAAVELGEELAGAGDVTALDGKLEIAFRADAPPLDFRLVVRGLGVRLRFNRDFLRKGRLITAPDGQPQQIVPLASDGSEGDDTADVEILPPEIVLDSRRGFDIRLDDDQIVQMPPLLIVTGDKPSFGLLVSKLKVDLSSERSPGEALARGFDEAWRGVYFEEIALFGMDTLFPTLPKWAAASHSTEKRIIELRNWFIGTEGLSGYFRLALVPGDPAHETPEEARAVFRGMAMEFEFDRGNMIKLGGEVTLRLANTMNSFASAPQHGDFVIGFAWREVPGGASLIEMTLRRSGPLGDGVGLLTLDDQLADVLAGALLLVGTVDPTGPMAPTLAVLLLEFLLAIHWFDFKSITLEGVKIRRREETLVGGRELRWLDFVLDVSAKLALNIPGNVLPLVPKIQTDPAHPITVVVRGFTLSWAYNYDDFDEAELGDREAFRMSFDPGNAVSFEVGDETIVKQSPFSITKVGIGQWDRGMWFELGVKYAGKANNVAYSVVPTAMRFFFVTGGGLDHVDFLGATFSLLVPRTIYARGEWTMTDTADVMMGRAYIIGWSGSVTNYKDPHNWMYNLGFGRRQVPLPPPPEPKVAEADMFFLDFATSSGIPTFILPGTNLYGISYLHADNARPAIGTGTPAQWLTQRPPQYQVDISKWEPALGASGWAAGVILGAKANRARPWNLKAGFMRIDPGPVLMLFGTANFLKQRLSLKDTNPASLSFYATLDLERKEFLLGVRYDKKIPDATGRELRLSVPAELFIHRDGWHLYLGQDKPLERHVLAQFLGKFTISGYVMFDTATIPNLAETGVDVPGSAIAAGLRFAYEGGKKSGRYKAYFFLKAAADAAVTLSDPRLFLIRAYVAGGFVAKAWGLGFEFEVSAQFMWIRPEPNHDKGLLKFTLDLPWPIPNLHLTFDSSRGADGEGEPLTGGMVDGLSLFLRSSQSSVEHEGDLANVPINPVFSLAFKYPTRNGTAVPGSFNLSDGSVTTLHYAGGDPASPRGYAITLDALTLVKESGGGPVPVPGPFPALWRPDPLAAPGGRPDKRILELFAYEGIEASRFIGASADYVDWTTQDFVPCPPAKPVDPVCYRFDAEPLGFVDGERHVTSTDSRVLLVSSVGEDVFAQSVRRYFRAVRHRAEVVVSPVAGLAQRLLRLPATNGATPPVAAADHLRLRFARAEQATVLVLRYPQGVVRMRGWLGETLVADAADGAMSGHLGEDRFEVVLYTLDGPLDRIEIEASHGPGLRLRQSLVVQVCLLYTTDVEQWQDQQVAALNWSQFWSDLLAQDAAASSALVLDPGTRYTLEVKTSWAQVHEDGTLGAANPVTDTYSFTTATEPPVTLRGPAAALDGADWDVKTLPVDGDDAVYTSRPIRIEFRDARTDKVYLAFGRRLVLRLVDEHGQDLFDRLAFLRENATDLPEYQRAWRAHVLGLPCALPGLDALWAKGVAHFDSVLAAGVRYDASLVMLPANVTDLSTVDDWTQFPVVYRFGFRTSRHASLAAHLAAHAIYDEICEADVDLGALHGALGSPASGTRIADDLLLQQALLDHLHLLPRDPPPQPELVRVWRRDAADPSQLSVIALLFDGPEAFLRADSCTLDIAGSTAAVPFVTVEQRGAARSLVLFPAGAGLGGLAAGSLTLRVTQAFTGADGSPASEIASLAIAIPARPATLEEERAP